MLTGYPSLFAKSVRQYFSGMLIYSPNSCVRFVNFPISIGNDVNRLNETVKVNSGE